MATLLSLKRRIRAARNVSKTTKAMQMIAASKLKKAQDATLASRPYVTKVSDLVHDVSGRIDQKDFHEYMKYQNNTGKTLIIALSPDKGLCGGLVTNIVKEFLTLTDQYKSDAEYVVIGKKLEGQITKLPNEVLASFNFGTTLPSFDTVFPLVDLINEYYLGHKVDTVKVLYTDFTSLFSQTPKVVDLLPITLPKDTEETPSRDDSFTLFEPNAKEILPDLMKQYIEMSLYQFLLESFVSEQASRMIAMQNATNNAKDIISDLQLEYNKTRQSKITSELLDITGTKQTSNEI